VTKIHFFTEDIHYRLRDIRKARSWILAAILKEGGKLENINFILTSDSFLHKINVEHLGHNTYTDIITFEYNDMGNPILSDIYISIDRCRENAKEYKVNLETEIRRILIHGVLHLLGYKDKTKSEKKVMTSKEDYYLSLHPKFIR